MVTARRPRAARWARISGSAFKIARADWLSSIRPSRARSERLVRFEQDDLQQLLHRLALGLAQLHVERKKM